jgi:hypothetical protein
MIEFPEPVPMIRRSFAEQLDDGGGVETAGAALLQLGVEPLGCRGGRQFGADAGGLVEADAKVLAHPVDGEAEVELVAHHRVPAVLEVPRVRGTLRHSVEDAVHVETRLEAEGQGFGRALDRGRAQDLIDHLGELSATGGAEVRDRPGERIEHRLGAREHVGVAPAHHRERAVLGARLPTGHRCIDEADAALVADRMELTGQRGGSRRVIDERRTGGHAGEGTLVAEHDSAHVVVSTDACEHERCTLGREPGRGRGPTAVLGDPPLCLVGAAVEHCDVMSRRSEVPSHRKAHDAETDEPHTSHARQGNGATRLRVLVSIPANW